MHWSYCNLALNHPDDPGILVFTVCHFWEADLKMKCFSCSLAVLMGVVRRGSSVMAIVEMKYAWTFIESSKGPGNGWELYTALNSHLYTTGSPKWKCCNFDRFFHHWLHWNLSPLPSEYWLALCRLSVHLSILSSLPLYNPQYLTNWGGE